MKKHGENVTQYKDKWIYRIPFNRIIRSSIPIETNISMRSQGIANYIGTRGYGIIKTSTMRCVDEHNIIITYKTKRLSLLRRILNIL